MSSGSGDVVFLDTETTGLGYDDHIWEFAAVRRSTAGWETVYHSFVHHDVTKAAALPDAFRTDHDTRYIPGLAVGLDQLVRDITIAFAGKPHVIGAVPNFDTERLARILRLYDLAPPWHYHLRDVETLTRGYLQGRASCGDQAAADALTDADDSHALSRAVGVNPDQFARHTALGDVRWTMAIYDAIGVPA